MDKLLKIRCNFEEEDFLELNRDSEGDLQVLIVEDGDIARIVLNKETAKELALHILANIED